MIRGTTPKLCFTLPFSTSTIAKGYITFVQHNQVVLDKSVSDCVCEEETITLTLTQAETLELDVRYMVEIQIRIVNHLGEALASEIIKTEVGRILKEGVIE